MFNKYTVIEWNRSQVRQYRTLHAVLVCVVQSLTVIESYDLLINRPIHAMVENIFLKNIVGFFVFFVLRFIRCFKVLSFDIL